VRKASAVYGTLNFLAVRGMLSRIKEDLDAAQNFLTVFAQKLTCPTIPIENGPTCPRMPVILGETGNGWVRC
jgi:hypothetical protein